MTLPCAMADILANLAGDTLCAQPPMRVCPHIGPGLGFRHHAPAERWTAWQCTAQLTRPCVEATPIYIWPRALIWK
jgi:hypothetical protein